MEIDNIITGRRRYSQITLSIFFIYFTVIGNLKILNNIIITIYNIKCMVLFSTLYIYIQFINNYLLNKIQTFYFAYS